MEKTREENIRNNVWDCGSSLYDSYELNSFKHRLDSAIANSPSNRRTLSMPRLPQPRHQPKSQTPNKISRTFHKLLRFLFKSTNKPSTFRKYSKDCVYVVYDKTEPVILSTIPELPEFEVAVVSPEITSFVRKSASERFMPTTAIGISCA
ncbi:hypothetical protein Fmac_003971 [Flemingia macrophylla]|uniref:Uncharacterized protein n=1 Tax=Flemingia macrophylla TaxID=520843 RepID=A0ABD1N3L0_9FABA